MSVAKHETRPDKLEHPEPVGMEYAQTLLLFIANTMQIQGSTAMVVHGALDDRGRAQKVGLLWREQTDPEDAYRAIVVTVAKEFRGQDEYRVSFTTDHPWRDTVRERVIAFSGWSAGYPANEDNYERQSIERIWRNYALPDQLELAQKYAAPSSMTPRSMWQKGEQQLSFSQAFEKGEFRQIFPYVANGK